MSVQTQLNRLQAAKTGLTAVLSQNGVAVPAGTTLDDYPALFSGMGNSLAVGLFRATFAVDRWTASGGGYAQTATATPVAGAEAISKDSVMASPVFVEDTYPDTTQRLVKIAGSIVDAGQKTFGAGTVTCTTRGGKKPSCDVEVFFLAKRGG